MATFQADNLTILFGDKTLSCDPTIPKQSGGTAGVIDREPFLTITKTLTTQNLIFPYQTHGTDAVVIQTATAIAPQMSQFTAADIVITTIPNVAIGVLTADCLPLILFDAENKILAAVHAGWRGTIKNVAQVAVDRMVKLGADPAGITAYFGPCAHVETYQASPELIHALDGSKYQSQVLKTVAGKTCFNLPGMNKLQLSDAGLLPKNINLDSCLDTLTNNTLWSYRRDGEQALRQPTCAVFSFRFKDYTQTTSSII